MGDRRRILFSGTSEYGGYIGSLASGFINNGWHCQIFDDYKCYTKKYGILKKKYLYRLFWGHLTKTVESKLIENINRFKPDILFIVKGFYYSDTFISRLKLKYKNIFIANFNPDNTFNDWHFGNSNKWILKSTPYYDCIYTWGANLVDAFNRIGAKKSAHLPFAFDSALHKSEETNTRQQKKVISFIGTWDEEREWWISKLKNLDINIYGGNWNKSTKSIRKKVVLNDVRGANFSKICSESAVNLNILRLQNKDSHNMKSYEIPGCGGFMLASSSIEHSELLIEGIEADYFTTPEELYERSNFYLNNLDLSKEIATRAKIKIHNESYSYSARARQIIGDYLNFKNEY
jgi:spore maturation protein CgeB